MSEVCDCSEDYGPCEDHAEVLAQRAGASTRTADDLAYVFLTDVLAIAEDPDIWQGYDADMSHRRDKLAAMVKFWGDDALWDDNYGCRWLKYDEESSFDHRDALYDDQMVAEGLLFDLGLNAWWEDGYRIVRVTGGPLVD